MKLQSALVLALLSLSLALFCPAAPRADEEKGSAPQSRWEGEVVVRTTGNQRDSYKFLEYRTLPAAGVDRLGYSFDSAARGFIFEALNVARDDQNYRLGYNGYGKWKAEASYDGLLHRFGYDNRSLYDGIGSGSLTINGARKAAFQAGGAPTNDTFVGNTSLFDPQILRKKYGVGIDLFEDRPVNLRLDFSSEDRSGVRPLGFSSNGLGGAAIEVPEPVGYTTGNFTALIEYPLKNFYGAVKYAVSTFTNRIDTLTAESAMANVDAPGDSLMGRFALYPNNSSNTLSLNLAFKNLFWKGRLAVHGAWADLRQTGSALPYTSNTQAGDIGATPAYLVRPGSVDGRVRTDNLSLRWTARPAKHLNLSARFYRYAWTNSTDARVLYSVPADQSPEADQVRTEPSSWASNTFELNAGLDLYAYSHLNLAYLSSTFSRTRLESPGNSENGWKASFDTAPREWFSFRADYRRTTRRGDYDYTAPLQYYLATNGGTPAGAPGVDLPTLRKFDQANRDQDRFNALASFTPTSFLAFNLSYNSVNNLYPDSGYGRTRDSSSVLGADLAVTPSERFRLGAFWSQEQYQFSQKGHEWRTAAGGGSPFTDAANPLYSRFDWVADSRDLTSTVGINLWASLRPKKLDLMMDYRSSTTTGTVGFPAGLHRTAAGANWTPVDFGNDDTLDYATFNIQLKWFLKREASLALGWLSERFENKDYSNEGFQYVPLTAGGAFTNGINGGGVLQPSYSANVFYLKYGFKI